MGFFSFLFGNNKTGLAKVDYVYMSRNVANAQLKTYLANSASERKIILIYFFKETKAELDELLDASTFQVMVNGNIETEIKRLSLANTEVIFAEPCTFFDDEQKLFDVFIEKEYKGGLIKIFSSLDDPLFIPFNVERIKKMMLSLGIDSNEAITSTMVTKSIDRAQKKLMKKKLLMSKVDSRAQMIKLLTTNESH